MDQPRQQETNLLQLQQGGGSLLQSQQQTLLYSTGICVEVPGGGVRQHRGDDDGNRVKEPEVITEIESPLQQARASQDGYTGSALVEAMELEIGTGVGNVLTIEMNSQSELQSKHLTGVCGTEATIDVGKDQQTPVTEDQVPRGIGQPGGLIVQDMVPEGAESSVAATEELRCEEQAPQGLVEMARNIIEEAMKPSRTEEVPQENGTKFDDGSCWFNGTRYCCKEAYLLRIMAEARANAVASALASLVTSEEEAEA